MTFIVYNLMLGAHLPYLGSLENAAIDKADSTKIYFVFTLAYDEVKWRV
jgi:hypothetical protein